MIEFYKFTKTYFLDSLEIKFYQPKSQILQKYLEGYYFLSQKEDDPTVEYLTFPNNYNIISIYENTEIIYSENQVTARGKENEPFSSDMICHYKKPIKIVNIGKLNELTFYFKPLGLNRFINQKLSEFTTDFFSNFIPFDDYKIVMQTILREKNREIQIDLIENYWISKLVGFEHPFLNQVLDDLLDLKNDYSITELAKKYNISRQNLNKHFENHLCKSPSDFKKIQRFRDALKNRINKNSNENLTSLSYDMLFYDQSHLIKDFKSLTGLTPKKFFKNISSQDEETKKWRKD